MTKIRIKICGVKSPLIARVAAEAGADAIGLNFVKSSPRFVDRDTALEIIRMLPAFVEPVGLFCDPSLDDLSHFAGAGITTLQLHGDEDRRFVEGLPTHRIIKGVPFDESAIAVWRYPPPHVTGLLIDAPRREGEMTGGTSRTFDWSKLAELDLSKLPPLILAGGLTPENVAEAIRTVRPWGVDVSSGVESSRGVKAPALIRAFCDAVRNADTIR